MRIMEEEGNVEQMNKECRISKGEVREAVFGKI